MGQRLVVSLIENEETIAVVYYHWSAYFQSTIYELRDLCKDILKAKGEGKDILPAVLDGLEAKGGGIGFSPDNLLEAAKRFPARANREDVSRNNGLMFLGEKEIKDTLAMAEGTAKIYLDTGEVSNDVDHCDYIPWELGDGFVELHSVRIHVDPFDMNMGQCIELAEYLETMTKVYLESLKRKENGHGL